MSQAILVEMNTVIFQAMHIRGVIPHKPVKYLIVFMPCAEEDVIHSTTPKCLPQCIENKVQILNAYRMN